MKYSKSIKLDKKVKHILSVISSLKQHDRYRGAFVFGSVPRGEFKLQSDIDVKVLVKGEEHTEVNHPIIDGIKIDISFNNLLTLIKATESEIKKRERIPMIAESIILFDKDGDLYRLKQQTTQVNPPEVKQEECKWTEYLIYNDDLKVRRAIKSDPDTALLVMHTSLQALLKIHYKKHNKWFVSNKRTFIDLASWDTCLQNLLRKLVNSSNPQIKYNYWTQIVDHVLADFGGRKNIEETSCDCKICCNDIKKLFAKKE